MNKIKPLIGNEKGFTLIELLIVVIIIAILATVVVAILNPTEILKKTRDAQRFADLNALESAIKIYLISTPIPSFEGAGGVFKCLSGTNNNAKIAYSIEMKNPICTNSPTIGSHTGALFSPNPCYTVESNVSATDGTGWIPIDFLGASGGSLIRNLPIDPVNSISTPTSPSSNDLVYRYACQTTGAAGKPSNVFEINAQLESESFSVIDDKRKKDGGDNDKYYEIGTDLRLIGAGENF